MRVKKVQCFIVLVCLIFPWSAFAATKVPAGMTDKQKIEWLEKELASRERELQIAVSAYIDCRNFLHTFDVIINQHFSSQQQLAKITPQQRESLRDYGTAFDASDKRMFHNKLIDKMYLELFKK